MLSILLCPYINNELSLTTSDVRMGTRSKAYQDVLDFHVAQEGPAVRDGHEVQVVPQVLTQPAVISTDQYILRKFCSYLGCQVDREALHLLSALVDQLAQEDQEVLVAPVALNGKSGGSQDARTV